MKQIPLNKGFVATVDDEDFELLSTYTWFVNHNGYAVRSHPRTRGRKRPAAIFMHRQILAVPEGLFTDHANGDRLDNRRSNIRIATKSQNNINRPARINNRLGVKGVSFDASRNRFRVRVSIGGKPTHVGRFKTIDEARKAYADAAIKSYGEFANLG